MKFWLTAPPVTRMFEFGCRSFRAKRGKAVRAGFIGFVCSLFSGPALHAQDSEKPTPRPNIVVVLADDLGYGDLGCYGAKDVKTPRIDQFASDGLRLTDCYSSHPNCSPSRAGLMTGRTPFRVGIYNWIPMFSPMHVQRSEITIATLLRNSGYDTCHVGKWHLNGDLNLPAQPQPWDRGFNHWFSTQNNALPNHRNPDNFVRNGRPVGELQGYSALLVAAEAERWLTSERDASKPFFLFACFHEPHEPIASAPEFTDLYPSGDPSWSAHHGNISQLDAGFGRLLDCLDHQNLRDNTLIILTSDNGPAITAMHPHGSAGPLRDKKGAIYDGGIRVPGIVQWPGKVSPGTVSNVPVSGVDLLPTLCDIVGTSVPQDRTLDGVSLLPLFRGQPIERRKPLYWQFNRAKSEAKVAIRHGDWKLVAGLNPLSPSSGGEIAADEMQLIKTADLVNFELFNVRSDVAESADVSEQHPDVLMSMKQMMTDMYVDVREEAPTWPAWEWPRYEASRIVWPEYWTNRRLKKP
ncbi:MAG: sulfatase-like hydrolase/transferase [Planctomycetaceae bacterium]